ncbi:MAG: hypothetical protein NTZ09_02140 [Candidatus Hydrogenedentes bacterium]|nr:hypothetical protein [Candidatus Hydrogenedentota bacterium]
MESTQRDASQALQDIEQAGEKAKRMSLYKGADLIYMVWGVAWLIGFVVQHFSRDFTLRFGDFSMHGSGWAWNIVVPIAIILTLIIGRRRSAVQSAVDKSIGVFWWLLFVYFALWVTVLSPVIDFQQLYTAEGQRVLLAGIILVPMFAYVVMGLFGYGRYMLWLGLGITAANVFGLLVIPNWYYLWMAVMGGGGLFAAGIFARQAWRRA